MFSRHRSFLACTILTSGFAVALVTPVQALADEDAAPGQIIVNGVREDVTEGSGEYGAKRASTSTKLSLSPRETPQSISVVTRTQIADFALNDVNTLLATTTGINVQNVETDRTYYSARGFDITNFQVDGVGQPFAYGLQNGALDTATFDRVEVLRGAAGLLSSTGNPSATINFVRKRPGKTSAASASLLYGSFDHLRLDADATVPLTAEGSIRARIVGAYQDTGSYLDRYSAKRAVGYGVIEADLGPHTILSAGYQHQENDTAGSLWGALPLNYSDGTPTSYPRSTSTSAHWTRWNVRDQQIFGDLTHAFGNGWTAKASVLRRVITEDARLFYVYGAPDPVTGNGLFSYPGAFRGPVRELTIDAYASGPLKLFGREHELVFGLNRGTGSVEEYSAYDVAAIGLPLPGDSAFDGSFPYPDFPGFTLSAEFETKRETAYGLVRLNPSDGAKLMLGGNVTHAVSKGSSYGVAKDYALTRFLPFVGATVDLTKNLSAYASFATIFNPQTELDENLELLPPVEGDNLEAGIKGEWFGGHLNASAAIFRARQKNTAESAGFDLATGQTLYRPVDATSEGIELDIAGTVAPGLQLSGGYTLMRIKGEEGEKVRTYVPRSTARLNIAYSPPALPGLKLGASVQYQSRIYRVQPLVTPSDEPIIARQDGYALVDLMARYEFGERWWLAGNLRNLTNVKYITSLYWEQGFYGAPRTVSATLGVRF